MDTVITSLTKLETRLATLETLQQNQTKSIRQAEAKISAVQEEQRNQAASLEFAHSGIEDNKAKCDSLQKQLDNISTRLTEISDSQQLVKESKPDKSYQNLLITVIPETPRENLATVITSLAEKIDLTIAQNDICSVYRTESKNICAKFNSELVRDKFYKGRRLLHTKQITTKSLGMQTDGRIYVNEVLDDKQREIFYQARVKRKELHYKFIWTFHGVVYVKKTSDSELAKITTIQDLDQL